MNLDPKKKTPATRFRHRISIQSKQTTTDGEGGFKPTWTTEATVWASVSPMHEEQQYLYKSINVDADIVVKIRTLSFPVFPEWNRILFGTRIFEVLALKNIQERDFQTMIMCKERREGDGGD